MRIDIYIYAQTVEATDNTVELPKKGHFGNSTFVLSSEVVLSEVHEFHYLMR